MEEVVKEELSRAACQLSPPTPAASCCQGDGPLCWPARTVALHCEMWRLSVTAPIGIDYGDWNGCYWRWIALDSRGGGGKNKAKGRGLDKYLMRVCTVCAEGGSREANNTAPILIAHLPLLWPSGPRRIRHSSIWPKEENIILTSFSPYFFETIPIKSFRSSTAAKRRNTQKAI